MKDNLSPKKDEEEPEQIIAESYEKMLTFLDKGYEVEEELRGETFLMKKKKHVI